MKNQHMYNETFLSEEDIIAIYRRKDIPRRLLRARLYFVLSCLTGLMVWDVQNLSNKKYNGNYIVNCWKTDHCQVVFPHPLIEEIIKKYNGKLPKPNKLPDYSRKVIELGGITGHSLNSTKSRHIYCINNEQRILIHQQSLTTLNNNVHVETIRRSLRIPSIHFSFRQLYMPLTFSFGSEKKITISYVPDFFKEIYPEVQHFSMETIFQEENFEELLMEIKRQNELNKKT